MNKHSCFSKERDGFIGRNKKFFIAHYSTPESLRGKENQGLNIGMTWNTWQK